MKMKALNNKWFLKAWTTLVQDYISLLGPVQKHVFAVWLTDKGHCVGVPTQVTLTLISKPTQDTTGIGMTQLQVVLSLSQDPMRHKSKIEFYMMVTNVYFKKTNVHDCL